MAFNNFPGPKRGPVKPAIGPMTNPAVPQLQPEMVNGKGQAKIMNNSNANTFSNAKTQGKPSGRRIGGKAKIQKGSKEPRPVMPIPWPGNGGGGDSSQIKLTSSDFGYNIDGSPSPNIYVDNRDQTLFRDYNVRSLVRTASSTNPEQSNQFSDITNQFKTLTINPKLSNSLPGYLSQMTVIMDLIKRDVVSRTKAAKGAIDALSDLTAYLNTIPVAFATLVQLESLQAWNPKDNAYFDRSLRLLASKMSGTEILELRTQLRQVLIPHVLPVGWMKYIKWIYSVHLRNHCPESTKLRFVDGKFAVLIGEILNDKPIADFSNYVTDLVDQVRNLNQTIPALMLNNVTCVEFANVKEWYDGMHNSASYDAEWNNIYNNRRVLFRKAADAEGDVTWMPTADENYYICVDTTTPYSMVIAQAARQNSPKQPGLPLEGNVDVVKVEGQTDFFQRFFISEGSTGDFGFYPVIEWVQDNTDSIHRADFSEINVLGGTFSEYSMPAGINSLAVIASDANCRMAARESLSTMTLK